MALSIFRHLNGRWLAPSFKSARQLSTTTLVCPRSSNSSFSMARVGSKTMWSNYRPMAAGAMQTNHRSLHVSGHRLDKKVVDQELVQFLGEEIAAEVKSQARGELPTLEGFKVKAEGSKLTFLKSVDGEEIIVKLNVNHTVDSLSPEEEMETSRDQVDVGKMESKPSFTVEIEKRGNRLAFACSYSSYRNEELAEETDVVEDSFTIDEVVYHQGSWTESTYAVSGQIIDGNLYDLMMTFLEERGIDIAFTTKLSEYCTSYEHKMYINLLENIKSFVSGASPKIKDQASRKQ